MERFRTPRECENWLYDHGAFINRGQIELKRGIVYGLKVWGAIDYLKRHIYLLHIQWVR